MMAERRQEFGQLWKRSGKSWLKEGKNLGSYGKEVANQPTRKKKSMEFQRFSAYTTKLAKGV
jgi:hypothetical protein